MEKRLVKFYYHCNRYLRSSGPRKKRPKRWKSGIVNVDTLQGWYNFVGRNVSYTVFEVHTVERKLSNRNRNNSFALDLTLQHFVSPIWRSLTVSTFVFHTAWYRKELLSTCNKELHSCHPSRCDQWINCKPVVEIV